MHDGYQGSIDFQVICVPKSEKSLEECEDVYGSLGFRFAISDGATEYIGSQLWARTLITSFLHGFDPFDAHVWEFNSRQWEIACKSLYSSSSWFGGEKIKKGSAATFLGIVFNDNLNFRAVAIGDSCAFHFREGKLINSWPMTDPGEFNSNPTLLFTNHTPARPLVWQGSCLKNDSVVIATDALSKWMMELNATGDNPLAILKEGSKDGMNQFIYDLRKSGKPKLDDDDVLAVLIQL